MKTVRLDQQLETFIERAAAKEGITVSAFIRRAIERECRSSEANSLENQLAGVIGCAASGGSNASTHTGRAFKEILASKRDPA